MVCTELVIMATVSVFDVVQHVETHRTHSNEEEAVPGKRHAFGNCAFASCMLARLLIDKWCHSGPVLNPTETLSASALLREGGQQLVTLKEEVCAASTTSPVSSHGIHPLDPQLSLLWK